jgi:BRCA1-associated protein
MQSIVPISIVLEIANSAPRINFEFEKLANDSSVDFTDTLKKMKPTTAGGKASGGAGRSRMSASQSSATTNASATTTTPPTLPEAAKGKAQKVAPTQENCFGRRKYAEVVVETFKPQKAGEEKGSFSLEPSSTTSSIQGSERASSMEPQGTEKLAYFCGNPLVEKTEGILHFYRSSNDATAQNDNCSLLCMLGVPAYLSCSELISFVQPTENISEMKIIRDSTHNQYMVILKFKTYRSTMAFYAKYNGSYFNEMLGDERCNLMFVERIETTSEGSGGSLPREDLTELPTCTVCLERLDDSVITILCNHTFHVQCLQQWSDTTCPVCRHTQTPEEVDTQKCSTCNNGQDLWMCLVCGYVGCGRYVSAHANQHFETTGHTFALQVGGNLVWDYAGDNFVHRIIQNAQDGKLVEIEAGKSENDKQSDKLDDIQTEYLCMLTQQLDKQRNFFEDKLHAMEESMNGYRTSMNNDMNVMRTELNETKSECQQLKANLESMKQAKESLEKKLATANSKLQKLQKELQDEQQIAKLVRADKDALQKEKEELIWKNNNEIRDLREQLGDLMMHFEAQSKIQMSLDGEEVTEQEIQGSSIEVQTKPQQHKKKNKKR